MGFSLSPYWITKDLMEVEMMIRGNRRSPRNAFGWKNVVLNLLGTLKYDQSMPWAYKVRVDDNVASDIYFYVDDRRLTAGSTKSCWKATQRVCQMFCFLGLQDECRKRTNPSQQPGEWAGRCIQ